MKVREMIYYIVERKEEIIATKEKYETKVIEKESPLGFVYSYTETTGGYWESGYYGSSTDTTYYRCNIYD